LTSAELVRLDRRRHRHPQLAPTGEDVNGAVFVPGEENAVTARRLCQAVDLLLERHNLGARLLQRCHEPLVVLRQPGDLRLRGGKALLQLSDMPRALGQLAPHQGEFLLKERDLGGEIVGVLLPSCGARLRVVAACHVPPPRGL